VSDPPGATAGRAHATALRGPAPGPRLPRGPSLAALLAAFRGLAGPRRPAPAAIAASEADSPRPGGAAARETSEAALRESEERLRLAEQVGGVGSVEWDLVTGIATISPGYAAIHGLPPGTTRQTREEWVARIHPEDREAILASTATAAGAAYARRIVSRIIRPSDGAVRWIESRREAFPDAEGRLTRLLGLHRDVTEQREAEAALAESEARFRAIAEAMPLIVWCYRADGTRDFVNAFWFDYIGQPPDNGDSWPRHTHPEDAPGVLAAWEHSFRTGEPMELEYRLRRRDGVWRWHLGRAVPMRDAGGRIVRWFGTCTDIEDMVRARDALAARGDAAVAERDRMWELSRDLLAVSGFDGMLRGANPAWERLLGLKPGQVEGRFHLNLIVPEDHGAAAAAHARLVAGEPQEPIELRFRHADGSFRRIEWAAVADDGRVYGVGRDVTGEKEREAALRRAQHELNQAQKLETIGQLTGGVAHDFNNLLAAIISNLDLLRKRVAGDERAARLVEGAIQGAERGAALTGRLLAFARRQELKAEIVDVAALLRGMEDLLRRSLGPGIELLHDLPPDLAPVRVDPHQLELALLNLAVNARDAMPRGGTLAFLASVVAGPAGLPAELQPGRYLRLTVADTGLGMDEETARRALEPFFTTKGVGKGTGLGLSMVHGLALQSGGALSLQSRPGEGTAVHLFLPLAEAETNLPAAIPTPAAAAEPGGKRPLTILVVDDDVLVSMGTVAMLEDLGHTVLDASSGKQALEVLATRPDIDIMITDHAMPGMTGTELARRARELRPELPVVLATGYAELPNGEDPGLPRLPKPFFQGDITRVLGEVVRG
jgi:PAS domain S-box-containing protein